MSVLHTINNTTTIKRSLIGREERQYFFSWHDGHQGEDL